MSGEDAVGGTRARARAGACLFSGKDLVHDDERRAFRMDDVIADFAVRQDGVVARAQLIGAGASRHVVDSRLKSGRLVALHPGVYRAGPILGRRGREWAALLACGERAALSHESGIVEWRLEEFQAASPTVHVSAPGRHPRLGSEVRVHRVSSLPADDVTRLDGLPITTVARTILDVAAAWDAVRVERVIARAERLKLTTVDELARRLKQHRGRKGTRTLAAILARPGGPAFTRSEAEARFLELTRKAGLRPPEANARIRGLEVDFLWRAERLAVEVDGAAYHAPAEAFERDRARDATLSAAGFRVIRVTWRQLTATPEKVLIRVAQALVVS